jgi:hypothetical protein
MGSVFESEESINDEPPAEADSDTSEGIKAHVMISRSTVASADATSAHAMAHFAVASRADNRTLVAAGLQTRTPSVGTCEGLVDPSSESFTEFDEVQLLDVGEVSIQPLDASDNLGNRGATQAISLAPHAFPSISSFASGVMYTSRDREAATFPSGLTYRVAVSGSDEVGGFRLEATAPKQLMNITLSGEPLSLVTEITKQEPLDVTWSVGAPGDVVVVELVDASDSYAFVRCAFADETGAGSIPAERMTGLLGKGDVVLHRYRSLQAPLSDEVAPDSEVRLLFDFETGTSVDFRR